MPLRLLSASTGDGGSPSVWTLRLPASPSTPTSTSGTLVWVAPGLCRDSGAQNQCVWYDTGSFGLLAHADQAVRQYIYNPCVSGVLLFRAGGPLPRDVGCSDCRALLLCYVLPCRSIRSRQTTRLEVTKFPNTTLTGGVITAVTASPDPKRVSAGCSVGIVKVLDLRSATLAMSLGL